MPLDPIELVGGIAIGTGVGQAVGDVVTPKLQAFKNAKRAQYLGVPLSAADAAAIEVQQYGGRFVGETEATLTGIDGDRYLALRYLAATAPGTPELLELWRRDKLTPALVRAGLKKAGLMDEFVDAVMELFTGRLDPSIVAVAIQRGIMDDPGFLPVSPPSGTGKVKAFPVSPLDPIAEAKAHGVDRDRLFVETAIVGNPMAPDQAAQATFRKIIDRTDFDRAISEGNTRNEWRDAIFDYFRQIPTAHDGIEARLRGWTDDAGMYAQTARHGMSPEDTDLLFKVTGRPLSWHQVFLGIRRGGVYDGPTTDIAPAFLKALKESNIRPEWYHIAWHLRFSYPSGFMIRGAVTSGDLTPQQGNDILFELGWDQKWIDVFVKAWSGGSGSAGAEQTKAELLSEYAGGYVSEAELRSLLATLGYSGAALDREVHLADARRVAAQRERVVRVIGEAYRRHLIDETEATAELAEVNVLAEAATRTIALWEKERRFTRKELTDRQVVSAFKKGKLTRDAAMGELEERGYSAADADAELAI